MKPASVSNKLRLYATQTKMSQQLAGSFFMSVTIGRWTRLQL
ncbi:hypothetical protein VCRA2116O29_710016 [Vibrio crassostreae]|nr:hypothetical protein VCRA2116O29_710016 [Vibrio crassostreae]CAK2537557.1 hypothetical protein VCRA2119O48_680003 [Vibrio crassostreae]CAK3897664.1 hypothetical protein VCRA2123O74_700003 [Vibrio crassostreae]CAK4023628.1 hypothetical protein VCRA212O16_800003 [Vibrio crassostreae]